MYIFGPHLHTLNTHYLSEIESCVLDADPLLESLLGLLPQTLQLLLQLCGVTQDVILRGERREHRISSHWPPHSAG